MWSFITTHSTIFTLGTYYVLSAAVGAMPMPDPTDSKFYRWFFQFANTVSANVTRAYASKLPATNGPSLTGGK
jgi:hypothetical protein